MSKKRRNPVAHAPILRKGGVHQKSRSGERQQEKRKLRQSLSTYAATLCGRDGFIRNIGIPLNLFENTLSPDTYFSLVKDFKKAIRSDVYVSMDTSGDKSCNHRLNFYRSNRMLPGSMHLRVPSFPA